MLAAGPYARWLRQPGAKTGSLPAESTPTSTAREIDVACGARWSPPKLGATRSQLRHLSRQGLCHNTGRATRAQLRQRRPARGHRCRRNCCGGRRKGMCSVLHTSQPQGKAAGADGAFSYFFAPAWAFTRLQPPPSASQRNKRPSRWYTLTLASWRRGRGERCPAVASESAAQGHARRRHNTPSPTLGVWLTPPELPCVMGRGSPCRV